MLERSLGARPIGVSLVIRACRDIGAGAAHDQPYKLFGYGVALQQHWHVQNKVALLSWIEKVGASNVSHFHLCDAKPSADLMRPGTQRCIPFGVYQVVCDVLRCSSLREFCRIDGIPPHLACVGSGCNLSSWDEVEAKAHALISDSHFRRHLGTLGLQLNMSAYTEHADCAERKALNDILPLIGSHERPPWHAMFDAWAVRRKTGEYLEALANLKHLM